MAVVGMGMILQSAGQAQHGLVSSLRGATGLMPMATLSQGLGWKVPETFYMCQGPGAVTRALHFLWWPLFPAGQQSCLPGTSEQLTDKSWSLQKPKARPGPVTFKARDWMERVTWPRPKQEVFVLSSTSY